MKSLRLEMAQIELQQLGFDVQIRSDDSLVIPNFKRYAEQHLLKKEGEPILNSDSIYHNYVYPKGIISGFDKIQIQKRADDRIQSITVPRDCLPQDEPNNLFIENLRQIIVFILKETEDREVSEKDGNVTIVLNGDSHSDKVLDFLINRMFASAQAFNPEKNYVSHIGRLIPIVVPYLSLQLRQHLLYEKGDIGLLQILVDQEKEDEIDLVLPRELIKNYIDKICREEQKLVHIVDAHLQIRQMSDFMATDADGIINQTTPNKIITHKESKEPLYIATTTNMHAFAVMIDFKSSTLFIANPGSQNENLTDIIRQLKEISGCNEVVWAITKKLERSGDIDIDDTCTADALSLVSMMRQHEGPLSEGCLNSQSLRTGEYAWAGLNRAKEVIAKNTTLVRDLAPTQINNIELKSLDKQTLKDCLAAYCPNSWTGIILFIITFGYHRSETIKALDALCVKANDDEIISLDQMVTAISQETCVDSRKQHRINLFYSSEVSDCSGTDRVIQSILDRASFTNIER